jgi:hypothetical protein
MDDLKPDRCQESRVQEAEGQLQQREARHGPGGVAGAAVGGRPEDTARGECDEEHARQRQDRVSDPKLDEEVGGG